jgi:hypothetical protein
MKMGDYLHAPASLAQGKEPPTKGTNCTNNVFEFVFIADLFIFKHILGLKGISSVTVKNTVFRDMTQCNRIEFYVNFGGIYCLHIQGQSIS